MPKIISIVGTSGSGKTTFMEKLIPELKKRGYRIGTVKHTFHAIEFDKKGKDSWRHKASGADTVIVASRERFAMVKDIGDTSLDALEPYFTDMDLVITEGYKNDTRPKLEIIRAARSAVPLDIPPHERLAVVTDTPSGLDVPHFGLEDVTGVADLIEQRFL